MKYFQILQNRRAPNRFVAIASLDSQYKLYIQHKNRKSLRLLTL